MAIPRQLPNAITVARIPLAIIFFVLLLLGGTYGLDDLTVRWIAGILFVVAISTDWVDGYLARKYDIVSDFGKLWIRSPTSCSPGPASWASPFSVSGRGGS